MELCQKEGCPMNNFDNIRNSSACAHSHLAQVVSVRLALKIKQDEITELAHSLIRNPACIKGYTDTLTIETQALFEI
jgi:hypothetical protein